MTRKGMSAEAALVVIVLVGIVIIVLAVLYKTLFDVGQKEFSKSECRTSLLLTANLQKVYDKASCTIQPYNPVPIKCSRRFITVTPDDVLRDEKSIALEYNPVCPGDEGSIAVDRAKGTSGVSVTGACMAENVLAQEMATCWDMFFRGEALVFQQVEPELDGLWDDNTDERVCFVCAEVTLRSGKDIADLTSYLQNKTRVSSDDFGKKYYDFLAGNQQARCNARIRGLSNDDTCWSAFGEKIDASFWKTFEWTSDWPGALQEGIKDGDTYAVTFIRYGMESACETEGDGMDAPTMTVQVLPAKEIGKYCDVVFA